MQAHGETVRVLVTVKATPQPSTKYGDTVCVAGVRIDGDRADWIRLYPIAFRWLDGDAQFHKYDIIDVEVRRRHQDSRSESYSPTEESWTRVGHLDGAAARHAIVGQLPETTTCDLMKQAEHNPSAPSLGLIRPADVAGLEITPHPRWTDAERAKMLARAQREASALLPSSGTIPNVLREPRFTVRYRYRCAAQRCPGHWGRILDWELTALQSKLRVSAEDAHAAIRAKYVDQMLATDRSPAFFMGNFENPARRSRFSVLGVYWPRATATAPTLF